MDELTTFLKGCAAGGFYGTVEVKFEAGHVVLIRKTETIKPPKTERK